MHKQSMYNIISVMHDVKDELIKNGSKDHMETQVIVKSNAILKLVT